MQMIADFVSAVNNNNRNDSFFIQDVQGCLGKDMKPNGWISLILSNREFAVLRFNNGVFMNEGFAVNDEKVLKVVGRA